MTSRNSLTLLKRCIAAHPRAVVWSSHRRVSPTKLLLGAFLYTPCSYLPRVLQITPRVTDTNVPPPMRIRQFLNFVSFLASIRTSFKVQQRSCASVTRAIVPNSAARGISESLRRSYRRNTRIPGRARAAEAAGTRVSNQCIY